MEQDLSMRYYDKVVAITMTFYKKSVRRTILLSEDTDKELAKDAQKRYLSYSRNAERIFMNII
jgi:hypothetical protein